MSKAKSEKLPKFPFVFQENCPNVVNFCSTRGGAVAPLPLPLLRLCLDRFMIVLSEFEYQMMLPLLQRWEEGRVLCYGAL